MSKNSIVKLTGVEKSFDGTVIVSDLDLDIREGEFLTILGPSGCGKTTTLRMIAGFETADSGTIELDGTDVADLPPNERNVNTVFQNYALFPHLSVEDNIAFGLVEKKMPKHEIKEKVADMLHMVRLEGMEKRKPSQLSGGQRQRVAIARALVNEPKVLLLDEPLGALDLKLRKQMQQELKHLQQKLGITFLYVTHDQEEALLMSDRIAVMNAGNLEQIDTPEEVYNHPKTRFVANFIGESNLLESYVTELEEEMAVFAFESGRAKLNNPGFHLEEMCYLCIRPENLRLSETPVEGFRILGKVMEVIFAGSVIQTMVRLVNGQVIKSVNQPDVPIIPVGTTVYIYWNPEKTAYLHTMEEQIYNSIEDGINKTMEEEGNLSIDDVY